MANSRYKSCLVDSDQYLLTCMRYVELNPVRANRVSHPGEYQWSSYQANAQGKSNCKIENHPIYLALGASAEERSNVYRDLFRHHMDCEILHEIRDSLNHELVLGRSHFKDKIEEMTKRKKRLGQPGRPSIEEEAAVQCVGI